MQECGNAGKLNAGMREAGKLNAGMQECRKAGIQKTVKPRSGDIILARASQ
jgi:hypothetical protein